MTLSNNQFKNVYNLGASRAVKKRTGQGMAIKMSAPDSPEMIKHENEAMAIANPKKTRMQKLGYAVKDMLGLTERHFK